MSMRVVVVEDEVFIRLDLLTHLQAVITMIEDRIIRKDKALGLERELCEAEA